MPVLTADTLAARADRDSAAAQRNDVLAGRRRSMGANDVDSGPEIIAPPQALNGDSVANNAPMQAVKPSQKTSAKTRQNKPDLSRSAQKSTSTHKSKESVKQGVSAHSR